MSYAKIIFGFLIVAAPAISMAGRATPTLKKQLDKQLDKRIGSTRWTAKLSGRASQTVRPFVASSPYTLFQPGVFSGGRVSGKVNTKTGKIVDLGQVSLYK